MDCTEAWSLWIHNLKCQIFRIQFFHSGIYHEYLKMTNCSLRAGPDEIMLPQNEMYSQGLKLLPTVLVVNTVTVYSPSKPVWLFSVVEHNGRYLKLGSSHWNPLISLYRPHKNRHFPKYLLCSTERKSFWFGKTWGWVNYAISSPLKSYQINWISVVDGKWLLQHLFT